MVDLPSAFNFSGTTLIRLYLHHPDSGDASPAAGSRTTRAIDFIPILTNAGADRLAAAGVASLVGISSLAGRLGTGYLLDHFRASRVGAVIFLLPIVACTLLMLAGANPLAQSAAAIVIGLTLGSEIDVIVYLTTKHFGLRNFGTIYGGLLTALSIGTAFGPLAAAAVYDHAGTYAPFLSLTIVCMVGSSLALASLPHAPFTNVEASS